MEHPASTTNRKMREFLDLFLAMALILAPLMIYFWRMK